MMARQKEVHEVKGWCPGALRPMMAGDGLVVRVRPYGGRLTRAQADGIATLAAAHGNGLLDISNRGNIQIRGVTEEKHGPLVDGLRLMGLIDATPAIESRRNISVTPFWQPGNETETLTAALTKSLAAQDAPDLPSKFGFAVDTGTTPVLSDDSGDIRFECDAGGGMILIADGMSTGMPVTAATVVERAMALAHWFLEKRGGITRMKALIAEGITPDGHIVPRQTGRYAPQPGYTPNGAMVGCAFGQMRVETLSTLAKHGSLRFTPWRLILVESARELPEIDGLITDPADPLLRITACTGAPRCTQALAETRTLGRTLAPHLARGQTLHISGCSKGCAHPGVAPLTLTARKDGFALIKDGKAGDAPVTSGLSPAELKDYI